MKQQINRVLYLFIFLIVAAHLPVFASNISISAEVTRSSIPFEEKDTLIVRLNWQGEPFLYQVDGIPLPELDKFEILGSSSAVSAKTDSAGNKLTGRTFMYVLQPVDYGTGIIKPLSLNAVNRVSQESHLLQTGRISVEIAKPVPREKESSDSTLAYILAFFGVLILAGAVIAVRRKNRHVEIQPTGMEKYIQDLETIRKETIADGKLFFSRLYRLLISYLEAEQGLSLTGKTGGEVIACVQKIDNDEIKATFIAWLERLHQEKYRPDAPSTDEVKDLYTAVKTFFEKNTV